MAIRVLPEHVAAKIAAGEVVERPASAIKELVENALDADARRIEVSVRGAGLARMSVSDDGSGMAPGDIGLALVRHATSKLPGDDLLMVGTLGYRGEALPSIASVASVRIVSRPKGQDVAFAVSADASGIRQPRPSAGAEGTRVEIEGLFAAHPARLKFMKSDRAESAAIREVLAGLALARPGTEFRVDLNGSSFSYPSRDSALARIRDVTGLSEQDLVEVRHRAGDVEVSGGITLPSSASAPQLRFVVNGRPVSDRGLRAAVVQAFAAQAGPGAVPGGCLAVTVPARDVDINVHPRKAEVRFSRPSDVAAAVSDAVTAALSGAGLRSPSGLAALAGKLAVPALPEGDRRRLPLGRFLGQANGAWLISETAEGIAIVDQHAAHERVVMERLRAAVEAPGFTPSRLERPHLHRCDPSTAAAVCDAQDALAGAGLETEQHEEGFLLLTLPSGIPALSAAEACEAVAASASAGGGTAALRLGAWQAIATAACRAAVKAGDALTPDRADVLLREIEATPNAAWCNHGRPTVVFLKDADLGKLFGRT